MTDHDLRLAERQLCETPTFDAQLRLRRAQERAGAYDAVRREVLTFPGLIRQLWRRDWRRRVFGADSHRYRLGRKRTEDHLLAFERKHELLLPYDYRTFLLEVGDGGCGPYYGLIPFDKACLDSDLSRDPPALVEGENVLDDDDDSWWEPIGRPGVLELSHHGCAYLDLLILRGPRAGQIVSDYHDFYYLKTAGFASWYGMWARRVVQTLIRQRLTKRVRKGMSLAEVEAILGPVASRRTYNPSETRVWFTNSNASVQLGPGDVVTDVSAGLIS